MVTLSLQWRSWGSQLSSRMKLLLLLLAGLSLSALAAGVLLRQRRRRYRAVAPLSKQDTFHRDSLHHRASSFSSPVSDVWERMEEDRDSLSQEVPVEEKDPQMQNHQQVTRTESDVFLSLSQSVPSEPSQQFFDPTDVLSAPTDYLSDSGDSYHSTVESHDEENGRVTMRHMMYLSALSLVDEGKVKCRTLRTNMLMCNGDRDFLAKLHCIRLAFDELLTCQSNRDFVEEMGRDIITVLLRKAHQDPGPFRERYDSIIRYVQEEGNWGVTEKELSSRGVSCMNVYDIALDFMLMDAFCDMENPPSALSSVIHNSWIRDGIKQSLLNTAVWSILKAKMSLLKNRKGFMAKFYQLCETISPTFAWGFLGTDPELGACCNKFKSTMMDFLQGIFSLDRVRYTTVHSLADDIMRLTRQTAHTLSDI